MIRFASSLHIHGPHHLPSHLNRRRRTRPAPRRPPRLFTQPPAMGFSMATMLSAAHAAHAASFGVANDRFVINRTLPSWGKEAARAGDAVSTPPPPSSEGPPAPPPPPLPPKWPIAGITFTGGRYCPDVTIGSAAGLASLDHLASTGASWVAIVVTQVTAGSGK